MLARDSQRDGTSEKARLVLFGSLGAAVNCADRLLERDDVELLGVVCSEDDPSSWRVAVGDRNMRDEVARLGVTKLDLEEVVSLTPDLGLSVRFDRILRRRHLDAFALGVVNLHGAPLPEMRGSMCDAAAILEGRARFGSSLHWMDEGVDSGDVLAVEHFEIGPDETVWDLFRRSNRLGLELIDRHLADIVSGRLTGLSQAEIARRDGLDVNTYTRAQVLAHREVSPEADSAHCQRVARAFAFPGHEPAWVAGPHGKVYIEIERSNQVER